MYLQDKSIRTVIENHLFKYAPFKKVGNIGIHRIMTYIK